MAFKLEEQHGRRLQVWTMWDVSVERTVVAPIDSRRRILEKLAEEREDVGRRWGATGYLELSGFFLSVTLQKDQPGRVERSTER